LFLLSDGGGGSGGEGAVKLANMIRQTAWVEAVNASSILQGAIPQVLFCVMYLDQAMIE